MFGRADTADNNVDSLERFTERFLGALNVTFPDFDAPLLQFHDGRFQSGPRSYESGDVLVEARSMEIHHSHDWECLRSSLLPAAH